MATLGTGNPTLADVAKRLDPQGKIDVLVEILNQDNPVLEDATFIECNDGTSHKTTIRSGLPSVTWRMLNYGVQPSKSRTTQVSDTTGMLEAYAEVDKDLADMNGNTAAFRMSEERSFIESMNQEVAATMFYGSTLTDPEKFHGLSIRYNALSGADSTENVISGGGSGADNTSIWLVVWGPQTCHMLYPKASKAGLMMEDKGQVTLEDAAGGLYEGYRSHYQWKTGMTVRDWQYVVRICNIDVSDMATPANAQALITYMIQATEKIPNLSRGRAVFYCNKTIRTALRLGILDKISNNLVWETVAGKRVMMFDEIPVKVCDALLNTESVVS